MGSKAKAPETPDYKAIEAQQAATNDANTTRQNKINRYNEYTPEGGSKEWTQDPNDPDKWTLTSKFGANEQQKYDKNNKLDSDLLDTATGGLNRVNEMMGTKFDISDIQGLINGVQPADLATDYDMSGVHDLNDLSKGDTTNESYIPKADQETRQRAEDALYQRQASRLDPKFAEEETAYATKLANKGLASGSAAYERAMDNFRRGKNDAYAGARQDAIIGGGTEMERDFNMGQTAFTDRANLAQQRFDQGNTIFNQSLARRGSEFGEARDRASFGNTAKAEKFAQAMANANMSNANRGTTIQERLMQRQLPLNEVNALRTGSQAMLPQFGNQNVSAASYQPSQALGAAQMGYNAQKEAAAAKQAQSNMLPQMLGGMAGMFLGGPGGAALGSSLGGMIGGK